MRKLILLGVAIAAAMAFGMTTGAQDTPRPQQRTLKPNQVARVGEHIITAEQLLQRMTETERLSNGQPASVAAVLDVLRAERILEAEAARIEADLKPREVQAEVDSFLSRAKSQYEADAKEISREQERAKQPVNPPTWAEWLALKTGLTEGELTGLLRIRVRNDLLKRLVIWYWFASSTTIDARLIRCADKNKIEEARQKIAAGAGFDTLVIAYSDHPTSKQAKPGLVAQLVENDGTRPAEVGKAAWTLKDGETSVVIESGKAWYLVRRERTTPANEARFFDMRESLLARANVDDNMLERWRNAVIAGGRYVIERRLPGVDCDADR
jgi:parvulin-like peptidyl-prolyl isomerase